MNEKEHCMSRADCLECQRKCALAKREESGLGEECGVFGMYDLDGNNVSSSIYYGLFSLQHRGLYI